MLNNDTYFSAENQLKYMSVSQFKSFEKCCASAYAEVTGTFKREETTALLVGSYVDAFFEGTLDRFKDAHPELFKKDGTLKSDYIKADEIIKRVMKDELFVEYMSGEKQIIMTGEIETVPVKIKIDSYFPHDKIVDLKVVKDFEPIYVPDEGRVPWAIAWGYDIQGAVYQEIVRQNTGDTLPFFLAAVTKQKEPDLEIIQISQTLLDEALKRFKEHIQYYDGVKQGVFEPERCEGCDFCKRTKKLVKPSLLDIEFDLD